MAVEIIMVRPDLENVPCYPLPESYTMRHYQPGDEQSWADLWVSVKDFDTHEAALKAYRDDFGDDGEQLTNRQMYLCNGSGDVIGTISAWHGNSYEPAPYGLIHWVAINPDYQAKKLGRPLLCAAMNLLRKWHNKAYLCTHTHRLRAVRVYLDMGFVPFIRNDNDTESWKTVAKQLPHPGLLTYTE